MHDINEKIFRNCSSAISANLSWTACGFFIAACAQCSHVQVTFTMILLILDYLSVLNKAYFPVNSLVSLGYAHAPALVQVLFCALPSLHNLPLQLLSSIIFLQSPMSLTLYKSSWMSWCGGILLQLRTCSVVSSFTSQRGQLRFPHICSESFFFGQSCLI